MLFRSGLQKHVGEAAYGATAQLYRLLEVLSDMIVYRITYRMALCGFYCTPPQAFLPSSPPAVSPTNVFAPR